MPLEGTVGNEDDQVFDDDTVETSDSDVETESSDESGESESADQTDEADETGDAKTEDDAEELISEAQLKAAKTPEEQRRLMNKAFTQKTQELAALRKEHEQAIEFTRALQTNPEAVIAALAKQIGHDLGAGSSKGEVTKETSDEIEQVLTEVFGEAPAKALMPAFNKLVSNAVQKTVGPIQQAIEAQQAREAAVLSQAAIDSLTERHPDWKQYEREMFKVAQRIQPNGLNEGEYLDLLYTYAARGQATADKVAKVVNKINKSAAASQSSARTVSPSKVSQTPVKKLSLKEAAEMAFRGERVER